MRVSGISTPARPFQPNEDWMGSAPGMVVVLDGCGASDALAAEVDTRCVHGLPWYVRTLGGALLRNGADAGMSLDDALAASIAETAAAHHGNCDLEHPDAPSAAVGALRSRGEVVEYLVLSQVALAVDDGGSAPLVVTDPLDSRVSLPAYDGAAPGSPARSQVRRARRERLGQLRNRPEGYPIAAADPNAAYRAVNGQLEPQRARRALLATDGVARLVETFEVLDWSELVDLTARSGPEEAVRQVRSVEEADPDCARWPRGRRHDDATVALCEF